MTFSERPAPPMRERLINIYDNFGTGHESIRWRCPEALGPPQVQAPKTDCSPYPLFRNRDVRKGQI
jgi:hypothetical protein